MHSTKSLDNGLGILSREEYVPEGCGYQHHYKYEIKLNTWGVGTDRIDWLRDNCQGKFGWYFIPKPDGNPQYDFYENQIAVVTFTHKRDATMFMLVFGND
jgi:hypothetical protein